MRWGLGSSDFAIGEKAAEPGNQVGPGPPDTVHRGILIPSNASGFQL